MEKIWVPHSIQIQTSETTGLVLCFNLVCTFWLVVYLQEVLFRESKCLYVLIINYQSSEVLSNIHVISQEARTIVISLKY